MNRRSSLLRKLLKDGRGAVALETPFVLMFFSERAMHCTDRAQGARCAN